MTPNISQNVRGVSVHSGKSLPARLTNRYLVPVPPGEPRIEKSGANQRKTRTSVRHVNSHHGHHGARVIFRDGASLFGGRRCLFACGGVLRVLFLLLVLLRSRLHFVGNVAVFLQNGAHAQQPRAEVLPKSEPPCMRWEQTVKVPI